VCDVMGGDGCITGRVPDVRVRQCDGWGAL
jgi:hypothetical protein